MPHRHRIALPLAVTSRLLALLAATTAALTAAPAPAPATSSGPTTLSPFQVEAEFGVDGLRIQPSQSVLNAYQLQQHDVAQFQDITGIAPNLFLSTSDSRGFGDILALRGVTNSLFFSSPGVALYVDDVAAGSVSAYPSSLLNIDSVTVRAGPHGTDYGRNAPGGVIDIKSRAPGATYQGKLQAEFGSYDLRAFQLSADGPISNSAGFSLALAHSEREGYIDNTFLGGTVDDRQSISGRAALYFKPAPDLQLRLSLLAERIDDGGQRLSSLLTPFSGGFDPYKVSSDLRGETQIERSQLSFQARKKLSWATLISTTARQEFDLDPSVTDLDLSQFPAAWSRVLQNEEIWSQEFRLESAPDTNKAAWRAGLYLSESDTDGDGTREFIVPPQPPFIPISFTQNERTTFSLEQKTIAAYASLDHPLSPNLLLKFGGRIEHSDSEISRDKVARNNLGFPQPQDPHLAGSDDDLYLSGHAGLVYSINPALNLHARTAVAHKPAGFSGFTGNPTLAGFDAEQQWANEIGLTFGPPRGRFGGSLTGFWNHVDDYQFERTVPNSTDFVVVNAPEVRSRGVEAKFMFSPVEKIWWDFQAGYTDATFRRHRDAAGASVNGKHVPFVPRSTLRTGLTIELARGLTANASYAAIGRTYYDERNTAMFAQKSYHVVNAQLRYRLDRFAVTIYGHNLTEEDYYQFINPEIAAGSPAAPRRYGIQVSYEY